MLQYVSCTYKGWNVQTIKKNMSGWSMRWGSSSDGAPAANVPTSAAAQISPKKEWIMFIYININIYIYLLCYKEKY